MSKGEPVKQTPRRFTAMAFRFLRRTFAVLLLAAAGWWMLLPMAFPVASVAAINARKVQVRSPIDGSLQQLNYEVGQAVAAEQVISRVTNAYLDTSHLANLDLRYSELLAERKRLAAELSLATQFEQTARQSSELYQKGMIETLQTSVEETQAQRDEALATLDGAMVFLEQSHTLAEKGATPVSEVQRREFSERIARSRVAVTQATLDRLSKEIAAASRGIFLHRDTPYYQQIAQELDRQLPKLRAQIAENEALIQALGPLLRSERQRCERSRESELRSPVTGIVWDTAASPGHVVKQGETVFEIADSQSMFVEAMIHQRHLKSLHPGCQAVVNLTGGETVWGRVRAVRDSSPVEPETEFALNLVGDDMRNVRVIIDLEPTTGKRQLIGRHARVLILSEDPTPIERLVARVFGTL